MPSVIAALVVAWFGLIAFQAWMRLSPSRKKRRALVDAIARGDLASIKQIVLDGLPVNFNYWSELSWGSMGSPLSMAFTKKDPSIADFLIANGASLSPKSPGNEALLTNGVLGGNFKLLDLALAAGHDIHFQPNKHSKPLARAIQHQLVPVARFLISKGANKGDLCIADCRWHAMNSETILFVRELGIEVPQNVFAAVENGDWDRRTSPNIT
jgi:hypothetical protein